MQLSSVIKLCKWTVMHMRCTRHGGREGVGWGLGDVHHRICVGWLVHVIQGHYVQAEPRSKLFRGRGGGGHAGYAPEQ